MFEIKNLKLNGFFNQLRLDIDNLTLAHSGIIALIGHNGAGKSSLLKLISGLEKPDAGQVLFENKDTFLNFKDLKRKIHLISWNIPLLNNETGEFHINLIKSLSNSWDDKLKNELIQDFALPLNKKVKYLSRGEQAKLKIVLSLSQKPSAILIDEVTNELDTESRRSIFKKLDLYSFENQAIILIATNMIDDIERYATSLVLLKQGRMLLTGNLDAIKEEKQLSFENIIRQYESMGTV